MVLRKLCEVTQLNRRRRWAGTIWSMWAARARSSLASVHAPGISAEARVRRGGDIIYAVSRCQGDQGMERFVGLALVGVAQP